MLWPPNAIVMAALLLTPGRSWPLVFAAVLPAHLMVERQAAVPPSMVLSWYVSNMVEALLGAGAIRWLAGRDPLFDRLRGVLLFVLVGGGLASFLSSFLDAWLVALNRFGDTPFREVWILRFYSNLLASLAIVPVVVTWMTRDSAALPAPRGRRGESLLVAAGFVLVGLVLFSGILPELARNPALLYLPLPVLLWAAVRHGPRGISTGLLLLTIASIWGAMQGNGPFVGENVRENVRSMQLFLVVAACPCLALAAAIRERERAESETRRSDDRLALALSAAGLGTWEWERATGAVTLSDRSRTIYGLVRPDAVLSGTELLERIDERDRALVLAALRRASDDDSPYEVEFRVKGTAGGIRWIMSKGTLQRDERGRPTGLRGVLADVTERKLVEQAQREEQALREQEAMLRELADTMPQIVFAARPDGSITYFNRKWYELTGMPPGEEASWFTVLHPVDRAACLRAWRRSVATGTAHEHEGRFWSSSASAYRWHLTRALPVRDDAGRIVRWYGTATDIDDRRRMEEALRESEATARALGDALERRVAERTAALTRVNATLREMIEVRERAERALRASEERFAKTFRAFPDPILIARLPERSVIEVNERWQTTFGFPRAEVIGARTEALRIFPDEERARQLLARVAEGGEHEIDMRDCAGRALHVVLVGVQVEMTGEPCLVLMMRDVTERRRAEDELAEHRRLLTHLGRVALVGELSGALAHELSQPLAAMLANARAGQRLAAQERATVPELSAILGDIVADIRRSELVIQHIRAMIRREDPRPVPFALGEVITSTLALARSDLSQRGVSVRTDWEEPSPVVLADPVQFQQVILNLVVNACEAMVETPPDERRVEICATREGEMAHVVVADHGPGIRATSLEAVFEPFVTSKRHGLGLGLTICRTIVGASGGRLWATNNEFGGATFHLTLPAAASDVDA